MATLTVHQWPDPEKGPRELRRVARGPVVVLTFDRDALDRFRLADYAPELFAAERTRFPALDTICATLGGTYSVRTVSVPIDCVDGFGEAYYARPEQFLDPAIRRTQSGWSFVDPGAEQRAVTRLRADLTSAAWEEQYGAWRTAPTFEGSLRLIVAQPEAPGPALGG